MAESPGLLYIRGDPVERVKLGNFVLMRFSCAETMDLAVRSPKDDHRSIRSMFGGPLAQGACR